MFWVVKTREKCVVQPIPTVNTLDQAISFWRSRGGEPVFSNFIALASSSGMTHVMQPAAHFVKTRDAGWTSKPLGLVKLVQGCSQNPSSVSVFLCSAQYAVYASTSSLAVDPWRTEHVGYHAYTKCPAF